MKILVTGTTGQVGGRVAAMLLEKAVEVRAFTRNRVRAAELESHGAEVAVGNFDDSNTVSAAASGCDAMFLVSSDGPNQVAQEVAASEAAAASGVSHIVKLSASDAGQRPYIWSRNHWAIEQELVRRNIPYSAARPHYFMQNYLPLLHRTGAKSAELRVPGGEGKIGAIDAHDIARAAVALLQRGEPTNSHHLLTGPGLVSFANVAAALGEAVGYGITYFDQPVDEFIAASGGTSEGSDDVVALFEETREGGLAILSDEVERLTGTPPRTIREFAAANREAILAAIA